LNTDQEYKLFVLTQVEPRLEARPYFTGQASKGRHEANDKNTVISAWQVSRLYTWLILTTWLK